MSRCITDLGICLDPKFMRAGTGGVSPNVLAEIINDITKPGPANIHGTAILSAASLTSKERQYYDGLTSLVLRAKGIPLDPSPPSIFNQPSIPVSRNNTWGDIMNGGATPGPVAPVGFPISSTLSSFLPTSTPTYGQSTFGQNPYGQTPNQGLYGQTPNQGLYGQSQYGQNQAQGLYGQNQYGSSQNQGLYGQSQYGQTPYGQTPYGQSQYGSSQNQGLYGQSQYGQTPYGQTPYGQSQYGSSQNQGLYGQTPYGQSQYGSSQNQGLYGQTPYGQTPYGQTPYGQTPYGQQRTGESDNPFHFLRSAKVPFDVQQQLAYLNRPVEFGTFFTDTEDLKAQFTRDYRQTYNQYLSNMSPFDRSQFGGGYDAQGSSMYQLMLITSQKEEHIAEIERIDRLLAVKTPDQIRNLTLVQLMQYLNSRKSEMQTKMNTWFYNQGIVVAANGLGSALDGRTGMYVVDRFANLRTFPARVREMKGNAWWEYSLQQLSAGSGISASPGTALLFMVGMAMVGSIQDGSNEHRVKQQRADREEAETLEKKRREQEIRKRLAPPPRRPVRLATRGKTEELPPNTKSGVEEIDDSTATDDSEDPIPDAEQEKKEKASDEIKKLIDGVEAL
jgi:hypothetical protein